MITIPTGKVIWFNDKEGYGRVHVDGEEQELVVRRSDLLDTATLEPGQAIDFEIHQDKAVEVMAIAAIVMKTRPVSQFSNQLKQATAGMTLAPVKRAKSGKAEVAATRKSRKYRDNPDQDELAELLGK